MVSIVLLGLIAFLIPIEHKYDKLFRFYSLTLIPEGLSISSQYEKKIYFYLSDLLALCLTFFGFFSLRFSLKKWIFHPLWLILLFAFFSIYLSPFQHYPIAYCKLLQLFTPIALFSFIAQMEEKKLMTRFILYCIVAAALFQAFVGIAQYFLQAPLGLRLLGEMKEFAAFGIAKKARWLLDDPWGYQTAIKPLLRATGTLPHANIFGGLMLFAILICYFLFLLHPLWLFALPPFLLAMTLSFSRSALFGWVLSTVLWFFLTAKQRGFKKLQPLLLTILITSSLILVLFQDQLYGRGGVFLNSNSLVQGSDHIRKALFIKGTNVLQTHPLFGVGWSQFTERTSALFGSQQDPSVTVSAPHNIFLFLACETGIFSALVLLFSLFRILQKGAQHLEKQETTLLFCLLLSILFIGCFDFYPILFHQGRLFLFLFSSLLIANSEKSVVQTMPTYG